VRTLSLLLPRALDGDLLSQNIMLGIDEHGVGHKGSVTSKSGVVQFPSITDEPNWMCLSFTCR
jgi:hypothetical protein